MNKFALFLLTLLISQFLPAQDTRFVYLAQMKPDVNAEQVTELVNLDISAGRSVFYPQNRLKRDSLMQKMRTTRNFQSGQMDQFRSVIDYIILKDLSASQITYQGQIGRDRYEYVEDRAIEWKIEPETMKIGEYNAQKAITTFGGRNWTAWFSGNFPFPDGPYKFGGLPGLIIKLEDESGDYRFDLKEVKQIPQAATFASRNQPVKLKRTDYEKQLARFQKDPASFMGAQRNMSARAGRSGTSQDPQRMREMASRAKELAARNSNPIEILQ